MAADASVNPAITDAITQVNVKVLGEAPAMALGTLYQTASHSIGIMYENAVNSQNQQFILSQANVTMGSIKLYNLDTIANAVAIAEMLNA